MDSNSVHLIPKQSMAIFIPNMQMGNSCPYVSIFNIGNLTKRDTIGPCAEFLLSRPQLRFKIMLRCQSCRCMAEGYGMYHSCRSYATSPTTCKEDFTNVWVLSGSLKQDNWETMQPICLLMRPTILRKAILASQMKSSKALASDFLLNCMDCLDYIINSTKPITIGGK